MIFSSISRTFFAFLIAVAIGLPASASAIGIEDFYGIYKGNTVTESPTGFEVRYLDVAITPKKKGEPKEGFVIARQTAIPRADGTYKYTNFEIHFRQTERDNVFRSAMRKDVFGNQVPLDPFKGDPFFWSTLKGSKLTVYGLLITPDGDYELQAYERTLTEKGIDISFYRVRQRETTKVVEGSLVRVKE